MDLERVGGRSMDVASIIRKMKPEGVCSPPTSLDHVDHVVKLALAGYADLAADHLLNPALRGKLPSIVGCLARRLKLEFLKAGDFEEKVSRRARAYDLMFEIALNLIGIDARHAGFEEGEVEEAISIIRSVVREWEEIERSELGDAPIAREVVRLKLEDMEKVMASNPKRKGMIAVMSEEVRSKLDDGRVAESFIEAMEEEIRSNVYYVMSREKLCKFGNDYAIGLRWLRRLGYVQVSTNPVLAAIAYRDDPSLWDKLREYLRRHPELLDNVEEKADEIAMAATMIALWPNMEVFRPIALLSGYKEGFVSYQLNPNVAGSVEGSLKDALKIYLATQEHFKEYDEQLAWRWPEVEDLGRPNIVFKVAGSSPAAIEITRLLESMGIGTNNTVTYAVSQEARLILAKMEGMAAALRSGIHPTRSYETNMGGRLEDHLREVVAARLIRDALSRFREPLRELAELAGKLGLNVREPEGLWKGASGWGYDIEARSLEEKIELVASKAYLRPLSKRAFAEFLARAWGVNVDEAVRELSKWEEAIGLAGTLVTQRVWWLFFSEENRGKWVAYLIRKYGLTPKQAEEIMECIDVLPASKRKPMDTYLTLASRNMTNTEFPDHQLNVLKKYREPGFRLSDYRDSVLMEHDPKIINKLMELEDFKKAYELTPYLAEVMKEVGVNVDSWGLDGLKPEEWSSFGPAVKTMRGFTNAYVKFREEAVKVALEVAGELKRDG
ncbi:MAG TPA: hypothetical protein ENG30_01225 [Thermofilaceae archaeon]|nr:hypothetical protein [Thermofilaceae archaeon]